RLPAARPHHATVDRDAVVTTGADHVSQPLLAPRPGEHASAPHHRHFTGRGIVDHIGSGGTRLFRARHIAQPLIVEPLQLVRRSQPIRLELVDWIAGYVLDQHQEAGTARCRSHIREPRAIGRPRQLALAHPEQLVLGFPIADEYLLAAERDTRVGWNHVLGRRAAGARRARCTGSKARQHYREKNVSHDLIISDSSSASQTQTPLADANADADPHDIPYAYGYASAYAFGFAFAFAWSWVRRFLPITHSRAHTSSREQARIPRALGQPSIAQNAHLLAPGLEFGRRPQPQQLPHRSVVME